MTTMICPKCHGEWRQYERNGVTVDQCTECRGIFLDRGELDRLIDAENSWHESGAGEQPPAAAPEQASAPPSAPPAAPQYGPPPGQSAPPAYGSPPPAYPPSQPGYGYPPQHGGGYHHRRKKSFLDELFD